MSRTARLLPKHFVDPQAPGRAAALVREIGWVRALSVLNRGVLSGREMLDRFGSDVAAVWAVLMPLSARGHVLLLSPHSISEAIGLARWCRSVTVRTSDAQDAEFLVACAEGCELRNVRTVGTLDELAEDPAFDAIVWDADDVSAVSLGRAQCLLSPDGVLYLRVQRPWGGTKWRLFERLRSMARWRSMLRRAGFNQVRMFGVLPDHANPDEMLLLGLRSGYTRTWQVGRLQLRNELRTRLEAMPMFCPSAGMVASAGSRAVSWIESLEQHVAEDRRLSTASNHFPRVLVSNAFKGGLIMFLGSDAVVRIPLNREGERRIANNYEALSMARQLRARGLQCRTPEPLRLERFDGVHVGVESKIGGKSIDRLPGPRALDAEQRVFELLLAFQRITGTGEQPSELWQECALLPFRRSFAWAVTETDRCMIRDLIAFLTSAGPGCLPVAASHGDYKAGNVLISDLEPAVGLLDWDLYKPVHFATIDLCHFVFHRRARLQQKPRLQAMVEWLAGHGEDAVESEWMARFVAEHGLAGQWRAAAALTYWAREFDSRIGGTFDLQTDWIRMNFLGLLPRIHELVCPPR